MEEKLKTVDIKGKPYVTCNERIKYFNKHYPNGSIINEIIKMEDDIVIIKTTIYPDASNPERAFTAHSYEREGSSFINKTSYLENCETSACARCLGMMGIGIESSVASAEEVGNAIHQQKDIEEVRNLAKEGWELLMKMNGGDNLQALDALEVITAFTGKDGKEVAGKRSFKGMSPKMLKVTYGKIKSASEESK